MTDQTPGPTPEEQPEGTDPAPATEQTAGTPTMADFSGGEGMVALAGILLLVNWLIFELIATEYFIPYTILLMAVAAAVLPRVRRESVEKVHPLNVIMKVLGYGIVVIGVFELIDDIRFDGYEDFVSILGALFAYVAYAMAFFGARSIKI